MSNSDFLLRPKFWYLFIATVIAVLFIYGLSISSDTTELHWSKEELRDRSEDLADCNLLVETKSREIDDLRIELSERDKAISRLNARVADLSELNSGKDSRIDELENEIAILENQPPEVVTKYKDRTVYEDRIVYKEKPEPFHRYGKGNGKLTFYKACNCYNIKFWIDGQYAGRTNSVFKSGRPSCGQNGTVAKVVLAGKHRIQAEDEENHVWDFFVTVKEDQCLIQGVE